ncbi:tripartite motif-containing protein 16-like isoform X1 [Hypanus sabinus]|uniref:tripartite motif-containing protein 16-like isoform X1 n=1 Tax=Hypanus sabinus TaxID=79690 RepID=UPI0028C3FB59|nr:tripartite motif-containing protein 16-like isoform X1 [Hypanus sabinus]
MAASSQLHFKDELVCAICLKLLTDPITIPCGHNICMECISIYLDTEEYVKAYSCPKCRGRSDQMTPLCKDGVLCEVVEKAPKNVEVSAAKSRFDPNDAVCDFCTGKKVKATVSCLDCMASFCKTHIGSHQAKAALRLHKLVSPIKITENGKCQRHKRPLDLFCSTDGTFICCICIVQEHENHTVVTIEEERENEQRKLVNKVKSLEEHAKWTKRETEDLRKQTRSIQRTAFILQEDTTAKFNELVQDIEEAKLRVVEFIKKEEQIALSKTEEAIAEKHNKYTELGREKCVMEELSKTVDNIKFLQESKALSNNCGESSSKEKCELNISLLGLDQVVKNLKEHLVSKCDQLMGSLTTDVAGLRHYRPNASEPRNRNELRVFSRRLTFDSKTAHKCLFLTKGNCKVTNIWPDEVYYVDHTERFDSCWQLLCAEELGKGIHYWEVETSEGCCVGVTYKCIARKGSDNSCFIGRNKHSWGIQLFKSHSSAWYNNIEVKTKSEKCEQIGVYLNYPNGILAFYAVSEMGITLLYRFQAVFTEPLYPGFRITKSQSFCCISD